MDEEKKSPEEEVETKEEGKAESEESNESKEESKIDFDAELEAEKKRGPDPEKAKKAFEEREAKRREKESQSEDDEDKPLTRRELADLLEKQRLATVRETNADRIAEIAKGLSESDSEARLIIEIHKNRVFPSNLSLREQLEESHAIANRKRFMSKNAELARALKSKDGISHNGASTHRDGEVGNTPKMSAADTAAYKQSGLTYDPKTKFWSKKLPNGKTFYKDPKTKRTWSQ